MRRIELEERRARLAVRHRLAPGHRAGDVVEAAKGMVCLHGTDPGTVHLSAWARVEGFTVPDLDRVRWAGGHLDVAARGGSSARGVDLFRRGEVLGREVGSEGLRAAKEEAARLTSWLGGLRVPGKFPSPLSKNVSTRV